jgi:agmatine deiminase
MLSDIPKKQLYQWPPEWQPHSATQMHWPTNRKAWPGKRLQQVEKVFLDIIEILHQYEPIHLFVNDENIKNHVLDMFMSKKINLPSHTKASEGRQPLTFHLQSTNDVWARDCGPVFIQRKDENGKHTAIIDWKFNAWGGKYPPYEADNQLPKYVAETYGFKRFEPKMILEGGSIESNGNGILLTTESVLLNENRNPELSKTDIEQRLRNYLGAKKIIWLKKGLSGDDTDGHIDNIARFLNSNTILAVISENSSDVNNKTLRENLQTLQTATDQQGEPFQIVTLPLPKAKIRDKAVDGSTCFPASYANFYIVNGAVLVPLYDDRFDRQALQLFKKYFPERDIHGIPCMDLVWGQGSIHCVTQPWFGLQVEG